MKQSAKRILNKIARAIGIDSKYIGVPKGIIKTKTWCTNNNAFYKEFIYHNNVDTSKMPYTSDTISKEVFSLDKLATEKKTFIAALPNGRIWGANGAVITQDDFLLEDVSREFGRYGGVFGKQHSIFGRLRLGKIKYFDCTVAVLSTVGCNNYYHWMVDVLPRIAILERAGLKNEIDYFVIDYSGLRFQKESLLRAGIPIEKIIRSNNYWKFHLQAKELLVPSLASALSSINEWQITWLRKIFLPPKKIADITKTKIYLSRKNAVNRKLLNEEELFDYLTKHGFERYFPEDYSIEENASVFNKATTIVSLHGAGNTNWMFAEPDTKVIEIFPPKQVYPNYWYISALLHHCYCYIVNNGERLKSGEDPVMKKSNEDTMVSIPDLTSIMKELC